MANEFETLARSFLGGKRPQNLDALKELLTTEESRRVLSSIMSDGGASVKRAVSEAQRGKTDSAQALVETLMKTPGGAELITKIVRTAEGKQ